jgi:hypothetical protein
MTKAAPDHEWELLRAIDPLRSARGAALLEPDYRSDLLLSIIATDRPSSRRSRRAFLSRASHRGRLWAAVGASGTAVFGGVAAAVVLLSSTTPAAYAGWTPRATTPTSSQVATATAACNRARAGNGSAPLTGTPVLTDQRGAFIAVLYVLGNDTVAACLSDGTDNDTAGESNQMQLDGWYLQPGPGQLQLPSNGGGGLNGFTGAGANQPLPPQWLRHLDTPRYRNNPSLRAEAVAALRANLVSGVESNAFGMAGTDVSAVTFVFAGGATVDATVQNGWYFAWWPSLNYPSSVIVAATSGTITSPMMPSGPGQDARCTFGTNGCVWAGIGTPSLPHGRRARPRPSRKQTARSKS